MTQHTPGPWQHLNGNEIGSTSRYGRTKIIAACNIAPGPQDSRLPADERTANARLIASAPDLLAALEAIVLDRDISGSYRFDQVVGLIIEENKLNQARAAIAKAKGE